MLNAIPGSASSHKDRGIAFYRSQQFQQASEEFYLACEVASQDMAAWDLLGLALTRLGRFGDAVDAFSRAASLGGDAVVLGNLGAALLSNARPAEALGPLEKALQLGPASAGIRLNLAMVLVKLGRTNAALAHADQLLKENPANTAARTVRGIALSSAGRNAEAAADLRQVMALAPSRLALGHLLMAMHEADAPPAEILQTARLVNQFTPSTLNPPIAALRRRTPLRVGYLSGDFADHPVAQFFEPLLRHHDPSRVTAYCYAAVCNPDHVTQHLQQLCPHWRNIGHMDPRAADMIRADEIDILVELGGHMPTGQLAIAAMRPAPICVSYIGYPSTTGLDAISYRITDSLIDPPGADDHYAEKLLRLPGPFVTFQPPAGAPEPSAPPLLTRGYCTFGSVASRGKISAPLLEAWAQILAALPSARLRLTVLNPAEEGALLHSFQRRDIDPARITLVPRLPATDYLTAHQEIDILLDSFPLSGHTTVCNALWMGVPVITLRGKIAWQRLGASVLAFLGLDSYIANSLDEYITLATQLAQDLSHLTELRRTLRDRLAHSPLMDHATHARRVEDALLAIAAAR